MKKMRKKSVIVLLGLAVTGLVGASAASLGVNSASLGAGVDDVASCDPIDGVDVDFTTTVAAGAPAQVNVQQVTISDVHDDCDGMAYTVALLDAGGATLISRSGTVPTDPGVYSFSFGIAGAGINAADVEQVAVTISG